MFHFKNFRKPGYSIISAIILGGLCVILVLAVYKIEVQRKKYMINSQRSIIQGQNIEFYVNYYDGR